MYQKYFGLSASPFSISPDPRYLFLSNKHREALAHLIYGVGDQGGFVVLTGEVGTGKTTICRCLLQQVPDNADIAFMINPKQSVNQLLQSIFNDLGVQYSKGSTSKDLIDQLNHYLLDAHARGRNTIVIIDEAQNLSSEVLEQLRLLTNLETNEKKLLQLVLLGQPELNTLLSKPELRQLSQRVTAWYHLSPLSRNEVTEYIAHRLSIAGCRTTLFTPSAIRKVYRLSQGVPRLINLICDRALLGVYATNGDQATSAVVANAAKEVFSQSTELKPGVRYWVPAAAAVCTGLLVFTVMYLWQGGASTTDTRNNLGVGVAGLDLLVQKNPPQAVNNSESAGSQALQQPLSWLKQLGYNDDPEAALMELYSLWRLSPGGANVRACLETTSDTEAIYCRQAITTISQLRAYNSPIVMAYKIGGDRSGYLLLQKLELNIATVKIGNDVFTVPVEELFDESFSHSYVLTRIPENIELPIFPGDSGPAVKWLQTQIAAHVEDVPALQGAKVVDENVVVGKNKFDLFYGHHLDFDEVLISENYDVPLQQQVTRLQEKLGMVGNAIIDIQLLAALNKFSFKSDPTLYPESQRGTVNRNIDVENTIDDDVNGGERKSELSESVDNLSNSLREG